MPNTPDPSDAVEDLKPEMREGPLGLPMIAPKGAPELGDGPDMSNMPTPSPGSNE